MNSFSGSQPLPHLQTRRMVRPEVLRSLAFFTALLIVAPAIALDERSALWVSDLQHVEEMIAASIETQDADELKRQTFAAHRLTGRAKTELFERARLSCVFASSALANFAGDLQGGTPASRLVNARADAKIYFGHMADCEKAVGMKGKRLLNRWF